MLRVRRYLGVAVLAAWLAIAGAVGTAAGAGAESQAPAVIIIDSSGSMAAKMPDGRTKLDAARAVVAATIEKWPAGGQLAAIAYGHRRKSDCSDIETILE